MFIVCVYSQNWVRAIPNQTIEWAETFARKEPDKYDGLKAIRPRLAQPWWYRLVGFTYAKPDRPSRGAQAAIRRNERKRAKMRLYCVPKPKPDVAA